MSVRDGRPEKSTAVNLEGLLQAIRARRTHAAPSPYRVPSLWSDPFSPPAAVEVSPFDYYAGVLESVLGRPPVPRSTEDEEEGEWSRSAVVYNMMVRTAPAFDHDGDGKIAFPANRSGWRENGSFLKAIAMLPYINSLGVNTIHLLPVQEIGRDRRRGTMGSVYAVRDLLSFDQSLSEPNLGMAPGAEFRAFVEAAHLTGLNIILEFPLRTTSKDHVWVKDHPGWFYWIRKDEEFHPPHFSEENLSIARACVKRGDRRNLPQPPPSYQKLFTEPPPKESIRQEDARYVGTLPGGRDVVIPGAFADWPPNDTQPIWEDITYLKYFSDERYNYIAYNTIRMYESSLLDGSSENEPLWSELSRVITTFVSDFGLDGVMIDMAHALPAKLLRQIKEEARRADSRVAFWAEDFDRTAEQAGVGFNVVLGSQWDTQHDRVRFRDMLNWLAGTPYFPPHLGAPETHNTHRAASRQGGTRYSLYAWTMSNFIPAVPYLHSGMELGETSPVNTGLGFTPDELNQFPAESLSLFSAIGFDWLIDHDLVPMFRKVTALRNRFRRSCAPLPGTVFTILNAGNDAVLAFRRASPEGMDPFLVLGNSDMENMQGFRLSPDNGERGFLDELTGERFSPAGGSLEGNLPPGRVLFLVEEGRGN